MHYLVALVVLSPLAVLLHELGHAAAFLWTGARRVRVDLGRGEGRALALGPVDVALHWRVALGEGSASGDEWLTRRDAIAVAAAGPLASLFGLVGGLFLSEVIAWNVWLEAWTVGNACGVLNLLPFAAGTSRSDGRLILEALDVLGAPKQPRTPIRLPFVIALGAIIPLAFAVEVVLGLFLLLILAAGWADSRVVDPDG
jgi:hypothetical protein